MENLIKEANRKLGIADRKAYAAFMSNDYEAVIKHAREAIYYRDMRERYTIRKLKYS